MQWLSHQFDTTTGPAIISNIHPAVILQSSPLYQTFDNTLSVLDETIIILICDEKLVVICDG